MGAEKYYKYAWICSSCGAKHNTRPDTCVRCNFDRLRKERYEVTASEYCGHINHLFQEGEFRDFRFAQFDQDEMCRVPERFPVRDEVLTLKKTIKFYGKWNAVVYYFVGWTMRRCARCGYEEEKKYEPERSSPRGTLHSLITTTPPGELRRKWGA